jgi:hypothetical protein
MSKVTVDLLAVGVTTTTNQIENGRDLINNIIGMGTERRDTDQGQRAGREIETEVPVRLEIAEIKGLSSKKHEAGISE